MKKLLLSLIILLFYTNVSSGAEYSTWTCEVSQDCWVPVYLVDSSDNVSGKTAITPTARYVKENATSGTSLTITKNCTSGNFCENDTTYLPGYYWVKLTSSDVTNTSGRYGLVLKATGILDAPIHITVVPDLDTPIASIASILDDTGTSGVLISDGTGAGQIDTLNGAIVNVDLCDASTSVTNAVTLPTIPADWITAAGIAAGAIGLSEIGSSSGSVTTGSCDPNTTLTFDTTMTEAGVNHWKDSFLTFKDDTTTAELRGQTKAITASAVNGCITVKGGFSTTPQSGDTFVIINK